MKLQTLAPHDLALGPNESEMLRWGTVKQLSVCIAITEQSEEELLIIKDETGKSWLRLYSGLLPETKALSFIAEFYTDARTEPLFLSIPWSSIGHVDHTVLLQYAGYSLRLFVDSVFVDEDWPMGSIPLQAASVKVGNSVSQAYLWKEAVAPEPEPSAADLEDRYLGIESASVQYWRPRGHNTGVGDCMPFFDGERFRVYYLYDRRGHGSKWGLGAHQWAQISTRDLRKWDHHPMAVGITQEWEGSICTGSVFKKEALYYALYAVRAVDGSPACLTWALSTDGIRYVKTELYIQISDRYVRASVRDPHVYQDREGKYHMLVTTSLVGQYRNEGCLAHLVSENLTDWTELEPFIVPGYHDEPECADYFEWKGWYYLVFSNDGLARYRYSRDPSGPWLRPKMDVFDCVQWRVPKTAPYPGDRRIAAGFLASPGKYGGELVLRELVQLPDGSLGLTDIPEWSSSSDEGVEIKAFALENLNGFCQYDAGDYSSDYAVSFQVTPGYANMYYGISVASSDNFQDGYDIRFEPSFQKAGIHRIHSRSFQENEHASIYQVDGLDLPTSVEVKVTAGWLDVNVNGNRTLISRIDKKYSRLRFYTQFGSASFGSIRIRSLSGGQAGESGDAGGAGNG